MATTLAAILIAASPAHATNFTWSGAAPVTTPSSILWSNAKNWAGGGAPSGTVGMLAFPRLSGCAGLTSRNACYTSQNDLSGLSVTGITIDDSSGYLLMGNPLSLGAGGLTASPGGACPRQVPLIALPLILSAPQDWSIDSNPINIAGDISGAGSALRITTSNAAGLTLGGNVEVGPVTIAGGAPRNPAANGQVMLLGIPAPTPGGPPGPPPPIGSSPAYLNASDGQSVTVTNTSLTFATAGTGPLISIGGEIAGIGSPTVGSLSVNGGLTADSRSALVLFFDGGHYTRISATGPVALGGATLFLDVADATGFGANQPCQRFPAGASYAPITTTGRLTGSFAYAAEGDDVVIPCRAGIAPAVRVHYGAHSFQVTFLPAKGGVLLPAHEALVQPSGRGNIVIACRGPVPCYGKVKLPRGLATSSIPYAIGSGGAGGYTFHLTKRALRQLRHHHGRERIAVTLLPGHGRRMQASQVLVLH